MTNFEKIKQMSLNEAAVFLFIHKFSKCSDCGYYAKECCGDCIDNKGCTVGMKHWLESEVEE